MPGRQKRTSSYFSAALRKSKNLKTRRTTVAIAQRDLRKLSTAKKNSRVGK